MTKVVFGVVVCLADIEHDALWTYAPVVLAYVVDTIYSITTAASQGAPWKPRPYPQYEHVLAVEKNFYLRDPQQQGFHFVSDALHVVLPKPHCHAGRLLAHRVPLSVLEA